MAEVTSGSNLTVIVLDEPEAEALAGLIARNWMKGTLGDHLGSLRDALCRGRGMRFPVYTRRD